MVGRKHMFKFKHPFRPKKSLSTLVLEIPCSSSRKLFSVYSMPSLPCIDYPEDQWQHHRCRYHYQPNVDPATVLSQTRAMPVTHVCKRIPNKRAVLQINQEWTITIQTITHIYCSLHLAVKGWSQPARCSTNAGRRNLTNILLPYLLETKAWVLVLVSKLRERCRQHVCQF